MDHVLDEYAIPKADDPSFSKADRQAQDVIEDIIRGEEENISSALPSLSYYSQLEAATRDMLCLVASQHRAGLSPEAAPADLALQLESPIVLSELRKHFSERIGDDYHWENFQLPNYMSL
ncbi:hypothetical protein MMYC01_204393 [Madurella mycetomatis]|uniref:Uncharacterized protein n=1 Tax=Madurella mycetomatis TaxID=100816 RepID=A0A175W830_9PEZI|nr:hypothetical protein MMYC01_204393 [Madurella mycetomatis]